MDPPRYRSRAPVRQAIRKPTECYNSKAALAQWSEVSLVSESAKPYGVADKVVDAEMVVCLRSLLVACLWP